VRGRWIPCLLAVLASACGTGVRRHPVSDAGVVPPEDGPGLASDLDGPGADLPQPDVAVADDTLAAEDADAIGPDVSTPQDTGAPEDAASDVATPGTDGAECDGPCPWTPAALGGRLVVWLDASRGVQLVDGKVARWDDLSGQGNHAQQPGPSHRPSVEPAGIAGRPGIAFNPLDTDNHFLNIPDSPSLHFGIEPFTLVLVAKAAHSGNETHAALWTKQEGDFPYRGPSLWLDHPANPREGRLMFQVAFSDSGGVLTREGGFDQGQPFILTGQRVDANTIRVRANGVQSDQALVPNVALVDLSAVRRPVILGANGFEDFQHVRGAYGEVIAIRGPVSSEELASLEQYLERKYVPLVF